MSEHTECFPALMSASSGMREKVESLIAEHGDTQVYVRADAAADYGRVVSAIAELQRGGVVNLGLITEAPDTTAPGAGQP